MFSHQCNRTPRKEQRSQLFDRTAVRRRNPNANDDITLRPLSFKAMVRRPRSNNTMRLGYRHRRLAATRAFVDVLTQGLQVSYYVLVERQSPWDWGTSVRMQPVGFGIGSQKKGVLSARRRRYRQLDAERVVVARNRRNGVKTRMGRY